MTKPRGTSNYSAAEKERLLSVVAECLPRAKSEWKLVAAAYNSSKGERWIDRTSVSLKRKFTSMHTASRKRKGRALTSSEKSALEIRRKIMSRSCAARSRGGVGSASGQPEDADASVHKKRVKLDVVAVAHNCRAQGAVVRTATALYRLHQCRNRLVPMQW
jgi:hypothetical protein